MQAGRPAQQRSAWKQASRHRPRACLSRWKACSSGRQSGEACMMLRSAPAECRWKAGADSSRQSAPRGQPTAFDSTSTCRGGQRVPPLSQYSTTSGKDVRSWCARAGARQQASKQAGAPPPARWSASGARPRPDAPAAPAPGTGGCSFSALPASPGRRAPAPATPAQCPPGSRGAPAAAGRCRPAAPAAAPPSPAPTRVAAVHCDQRSSRRQAEAAATAAVRRVGRATSISH